MKKLMADPTIGRFLVNGLVATGVHFAVLSLLIEVAGVRSAGLANGIAAVFGIAASYVGSRCFVFNSSAPVIRTLPRFLLICASVSCLHTLVLAIWTDMWRQPYVIGFLIATAGSTALNFLASRFIVFAEPPERS
jgi:putative flippase GtrA